MRPHKYVQSNNHNLQCVDVVFEDEENALMLNSLPASLLKKSMELEEIIWALLVVNVRKKTSKRGSE